MAQFHAEVEYAFGDSGKPFALSFSHADPVTADSGARLRRGQLVEVKSAREIAATLDGEGRLDGLPFMPEMARYCGRRFRVGRRADMTCVEAQGLRRMAAAVFLDDVRCDGSAHDACQRRCLIFWKEAWLKPVDSASRAPATADAAPAAPTADARALGQLPTREHGHYICQSTALAAATRDLPIWDLRPYLAQMRDGELTALRFFLIVGLVLVNLLRRFFGLREVDRLAGPKSASAHAPLNLKPGEWVRVKSRAEIRKTLDANGRTRGLAFEPEMSGFAGKLFQVDFVIKNMIHEETGKMIHPTDTVVLKGLTCQGLCAKNCPRSNYWFWREDWLDRAPAPIRSTRGAQR